MKRLRSLTFATLALLLAPAHAALTPPAAAPATPAPVPARTPADGPFLPAAALPGGLVLGGHSSRTQQPNGVSFGGWG